MQMLDKTDITHTEQIRLDIDKPNAAHITSLLDNSVKCALLNYWDGYFKCLKQIWISLESEATEEEIIDHKHMLSQCREDLKMFNKICFICGIRHDFNSGGYVLSNMNNNNRYYQYANQYRDLNENLENKLDCWQAEIRKVMKRTGFLMLQKKRRVH